MAAIENDARWREVAVEAELENSPLVRVRKFEREERQ